MMVDKEWDVLVILDACRYDMFKEVYEEFYPNSKLKKIISPSTYTADWLNKEFPGYYPDIVYISANAYVNSQVGVSHKFRSWWNSEFNSYDAKEHFPIIVDAWVGKDKYDHSVHPLRVNKAFHKYYLMNPKKRFILHYMQPHRPYINTPKQINFGKKFSTPKFARDTFSMAMNWKIKKFLLRKPNSYEEDMYRDYGWDGLKKVYKDEIRFALEYVKNITDSLNLKFVITSDHGERLGEHWWHMSHGPGPRHKEVIEVPYLEV